VSPGDALGFQIEASVPVYVYVVNEDDRGEAYLLFPLPGQEVANPLGGGTAHELPGPRDGKDFHWQVTSAGGQEHFLVFVSPRHLTVFDGLLQSLAHPAAGRPITGAQLPDSIVSHLRGVGGLVPDKGGTEPSSAHYLFENADPLGPDADTAHGVWVRQLTFRNPGS
jgi:hypothetical protein